MSKYDSQDEYWKKQYEKMRNKPISKLEEELELAKKGIELSSNEYHIAWCNRWIWALRTAIAEKIGK